MSLITLNTVHNLVPFGNKKIIKTGQKFNSEPITESITEPIIESISESNTQSNTELNTQSNTGSEKSYMGSTIKFLDHMTQYMMEGELDLIYLEEEKIKLDFVSMGSHGVIVIDNRNKDYIYKITVLYDGTELCINNLIECVFLNNYKNKYYTISSENYFPVQNEITEIMTLGEFKSIYELDTQIIKALEQNLIISDENYIIINKMPNYKKNLECYLGRKIKVVLDNYYEIVRQILLGVNLIHSSGYFHGDLKTPNMILKDTNCKIIDFGGIKPIGSNKFERTYTVSYRPPEDLSYEFDVIDKLSCSDLSEYELRLSLNKYFITKPSYEIWSVGMIMLELLIGYNPINSLYSKLMITHKSGNIDRVNTLIESQINDYYKSIPRFEINEFIPRHLRSENNTKLFRVIQKMLSINPYERYQNIGEIYRELFSEEIKNPEKTEYLDTISYSLSIKHYKLMLNNYRRIYYPKIFDFLRATKFDHVIVMMCDLIDKYLVKSINTYDWNIINMITVPENHQETSAYLMSSIFIISVSLIYREQILLDNLINHLNTHNWTNNWDGSKIYSIFGWIRNVMNILNFNLIDDRYDLLKINNIERTIEEFNKVLEVEIG